MARRPGLLWMALSGGLMASAIVAVAVILGASRGWVWLSFIPALVAAFMVGWSWPR